MKTLGLVALLAVPALAWLLFDRLRASPSTVSRGALGVALSFLLLLLLAGPSFGFLLALLVGLLLERLFPRRPLPFASVEKFRAVVFLTANLAAVGTLQLVTFGEVIDYAAPTWGLAAQGTPVALQVIAFLVLNDLKNYWIHRMEHRVSFFWRFHRIHHADTEVSILSPRDHISYGLEKFCSNLLLAYGMGISAAAFGVAIVVWQILVQLNHVSVDFPSSSKKMPWFARIVTTPTVHGWHHTVEGSKGVNLADILPLWDTLFGTFDHPAAPVREWRWGVSSEEATAPTVLGQLWAPIRAVLINAPSSSSSSSSSPE